MDSQFKGSFLVDAPATAQFTPTKVPYTMIIADAEIFIIGLSVSKERWYADFLI